MRMVHRVFGNVGYRMRKTWRPPSVSVAAVANHRPTHLPDWLGRRLSAIALLSTLAACGPGINENDTVSLVQTDLYLSAGVWHRGSTQIQVDSGVVTGIAETESDALKLEADLDLSGYALCPLDSNCELGSGDSIWVGGPASFEALRAPLRRRADRWRVQNGVVQRAPGLMERFSDLATRLGPLTLGGLGLILSVFMVGVATLAIPLWSLTRAVAALTGARDPASTRTANEALNIAMSRFKTEWDQNIFQDEKAGALSLVEPSQFLREEVLIGRRRRLFAQGMPALLTGLGILGTFVGIAWGLSQGSLLSTEAADLLSGMQPLIAGMRAAFWTSIAGIAAGLLWTVAFHHLRGDLQNRLDTLCQRFASITAMPERLAVLTVNRLAEQTILLDKQKGLLQSLGNDLVDKFDEALRSGFNDTLKPALEGLSESMKALSEDVSNREMEGVERLVESFRDTLSAGLQSDLERMTTLVREAADHQEQVSADLREAYSLLSDISEAQSGLLESTTTAAQEFVEAIAGLEVAHSSITTVAKETAQLVAETTRMAGESRVHADVYTAASEQLQTALSASVDEVAAQVSQLSHFWDAFEGSFKKLNQDLSENVTEFTALTAQKIQEVFLRFDSEMAEVVSRLSATLADIRDVSDVLPPAVAQMTESIGSLPKAAESVRASAQMFAASFERASESSGPTLQAVVGQLTETQQALDRLTRKFGESGDSKASVEPGKSIADGYP